MNGATSIACYSVVYTNKKTNVLLTQPRQPKKAMIESQARVCTTTPVLIYLDSLTKVIPTFKSRLYHNGQTVYTWDFQVSSGLNTNLKRWEYHCFWENISAACIVGMKVQCRGRGNTRLFHEDIFKATLSCYNNCKDGISRRLLSGFYFNHVRDIFFKSGLAVSYDRQSVLLFDFVCWLFLHMPGIFWETEKISSHFYNCRNSKTDNFQKVWPKCH